jgi:DNA-binding CsgD family transcriptional regulator
MYQEISPELGRWADTYPEAAAHAFKFEVLTVQSLSAAGLTVKVRGLTETAFNLIVESKFEALAQAAKLSQRERSVFRLLVMGRSLEDIATILSITRRTVRFHQDNVVDKLGADSREDLIRLIF